MTAYMLRRLATAAALRVRARGWAEVAAAVASRPEVCRRWPDRYPAEWQRLTAEAQRMVQEELRATALQALADLARTGDERMRKRAGRLLERYGDDGPNPRQR